MKAKGQSAKMGDVIPYIFCVPDGGVGQTSGKAANAYHPDDVRRAGSTLKIGARFTARDTFGNLHSTGMQTTTSTSRVRSCRPSSVSATRSKARRRRASPSASVSPAVPFVWVTLTDLRATGLDISKYKANNDIPEREFKTLQSQISDEQRFLNAKSLSIRCRSCGVVCDFDGIANNSVCPFLASQSRASPDFPRLQGHMLSTRGFMCSDVECAQQIPTASIAVQLDLQIRSYVAKFYEGWLVCDDASCGNRTRMMSVYGKRCLVAACRGQMHYEVSFFFSSCWCRACADSGRQYSDSMLYNQILFLDGLFDGEKTRTKLTGTSKHGADYFLSSTLCRILTCPSSETVSNLVDSNAAVLAQLRAVVQKHLDKNGRRWVNLGSLFSWSK